MRGRKEGVKKLAKHGGSGLARDGGDEMCQLNRSDPIASKPAPTPEVGVSATAGCPAPRSGHRARFRSTG
ncbi:hypothetical protein F7Q95_16290 [Pseudomonas psychrophila]|nr:hypothetical protein F7Q95_16290 [Pseudomonas psychrophila]